MFPNWMLNCYPDNMSLNIVLPLGHDRCIAIFAWFFPEAALATAVPEQTFRFSDEIQIEDGAIWVYGIGEDGIQAFTDFGIENLIELVRLYKQNPDLLRR